MKKKREKMEENIIFISFSLRVYFIVIHLFDHKYKYKSFRHTYIKEKVWKRK